MVSLPRMQRAAMRWRTPAAALLLTPTHDSPAHLRTCHPPPPLRSHTFDWQPSGVTWYVDGTQWEFKAAPVPSKPQVTLLSIWTMNSKDFGGVLSSLDHPPYYSYFKDVVRLVCDLPEPKVGWAAVG